MGVGEWGWGADLPDIFKSNKKERKEQKHFIILGKLNPDGGGGGCTCNTRILLL